MNVEHLKECIHECFGKYTFSMDQLYERLQQKPGCPTFDELNNLVQLALKQKVLKKYSHQRKNDPMKYKLNVEPKLSVAKTIEGIRGACRQTKGKPVHLGNLTKTMTGAYSSRIRSTVSILNTLNIVQIGLERPFRITWNDERSNYFKSNSFACQMAQLIKLQKHRNKLLLKLQRYEGNKEMNAIKQA